MHVHLFMLANVTFPLVEVDKRIMCSVWYYGFLTLVPYHTVLHFRVCFFLFEILMHAFPAVQSENQHSLES